MEIHGVFSAYNLSDDEKDLFAEYLQYVMNNPLIEFVKYLLGDDYLKFIDIMSGTTFKIPSAKALERDLESVRIFLYMKNNNFTEESIKSVAKMYGRTVLTSKRAAYRVAKALGIEDALEGDALNNFLLNLKSMDYPDTNEDTVEELLKKKREREENESSEDTYDDSSNDLDDDIIEKYLNEEQEV